MMPNKISVLATDLDGTLIPIDRDESQVAALTDLAELIQASDLKFLFVTGRSTELTLQAIEEFSLPTPDAILCDVGSRLLRRSAAGEFLAVDEYQQTVSSKLGDWNHQRICEAIESANLPLELQGAALQTDVKCSFYFDAAQISLVEDRTSRWISDQAAPLQLVASVDPIDGRGLLDLLPMGVNKAFGLHWWREAQGFSASEVVFCGDSGNDTAAMTSGVRSIVVANGADSLRTAAVAYHQDPSWLYLASQPATCGVLDGLRYFLHH